MQDEQYLASQSYSLSKFIFMNLFLCVILSGLGILVGKFIGDFKTTNMVYILPILFTAIMAIINVWNRIAPKKYKALIIGYLFSGYLLSGTIHFEYHMTGNKGTIIFILLFFVIALFLPLINIGLARKLFYIQQGVNCNGKEKKQNYKLLSSIVIICVVIGKSSLLVINEIDYRLVLFEILMASLAIIFVQSLSYQLWELLEKKK